MNTQTTATAKPTFSKPTFVELARAEGRCVNCSQIRPTQPVPLFAGTMFAEMCAECRQQSAMNRQARAVQAAEIHARALALFTEGLTAADLMRTAKAGEDPFGVRDMDSAAFTAFLLAAEDAQYFYPAGHSMRDFLGWVRPACDRVRTDWRRRQARFADARRRLGAFSTPAPEALLQYAEAA